MKILLRILPCVFLLFAFLIPVGAADNLLTNGGFESTITKNWQSDCAELYRSMENKTSGKYSCFAPCQSSGNALWQAVAISVPQCSQVCLRANVLLNTASSSAVTVRLGLTYSENSNQSTYYSSPATVELNKFVTIDLKNLEGELYVLPKNTAIVSVFLTISAASDIFIDDFSLTLPEEDCTAVPSATAINKPTLPPIEATQMPTPTKVPDQSSTEEPGFDDNLLTPFSTAFPTGLNPNAITGKTTEDTASPNESATSAAPTPTQTSLPVIEHTKEDKSDLVLGGTIAIGGAVAAGGAFLIVSYVKKSREIKTISLKKGEN